ncbi:MAG: tetratricopeptide repeat protein [Chthonomonadales bacterium]|nr:tetratricopeptide repeat protein [Chthonomonadales bacterium]
MLTQPWRIYLLGTFRVVSGDQVITRCSTRKTEELLALLAYRLGQQCSRSELTDMFWPDSEIEAGYTNLRGSLLSLRRQLEPPGVPAGSVLVSHGRHAISLNPEAATCDVVDFRRLIKQRPTHTPEQRMQRLLAAIELYKGELMPGHDEVWIEDIRRSLAEQFFEALREVSNMMAATGEIERAIEHAHRAVIQDPLREESHCELMRLYALAGRPEDAVRAYENMARLFEREEMDPPSREAWSLLEQARNSSRASARGTAPARSAPWRSAPEPLAAEDDDEEPPPFRPGPAPVADTASAAKPPPAIPSRRPASGPEAGALQPSDEDDVPFVHQHTVDSVRRSDTGIPLQFTRFFGREKELQRIDSLVRSGLERLITIIGPCGIGKTRLSVEYAALAARSLDRRVLFVPMDDLHSAPAAMARIADGLGITLRPGQSDPMKQLADELSLRPTLLILDNLEQLVDELAPLVHRLVVSVASLIVVATTRHALELSGEQLVPLEPLPVPEITALTPEALMAVPSVQLFVDRAARVVPDFAVTARNAPDIAAVCRGLEGLPLSIELAAALAQDRTPKQMVRDLSRKFDFLVSRKRDVPDRHATLRACLEWSYRLLPEHLTETFAALAVFEGGFTMEAAEAVCQLERPFATLQELRSRSLITAQRLEEEVSYGMLDALHAFAAEKLPDDRREELARRHAAYFAELCAESEPHLWRSGQSEWLVRLTAEAPNIRAALTWSLERDPTTAIRIGRDLGRFWIVKGYGSDGRHWLQRCAEAARDTGDQVSEGALLSLCGALSAMEGEWDEGLRQADTGVGLVRAHDDPVALARALINLGIVRQHRGELRDARVAFDEALAHAESRGVRHVAAVAIGNSASACLAAGEFADAQALAERALGLARDLGDDWLCSMLLLHLGDIACERYDAASARRHYTEALELLLATGDVVHAARALWQLAAVLAYQEDLSGAAYLIGAATGMQTTHGLRLDTDDDAAHRGTVELVQDRLAVAAYESNLALGADADPSSIPQWLAVRGS